MESRPLRLIIAGVVCLGMLLTPCAAASAFSPGCAMPDCEESHQSLAGPGSCCCASSPAQPQDAGAKSSAPLVKVQIPVSFLDEAAPIADLSPAGGTVTLLQPDDVPLYLLHATLLI
jgi:hypothetical protein